MAAIQTCTKGSVRVCVIYMRN